MLNRHFLAAIILTCLSISSYAQVIGDFEIKANSLSYSDDGTSLEATGSGSFNRGSAEVFGSETNSSAVFPLPKKGRRGGQNAPTAALRLLRF